jgi:hypothetical protein
MSFFFAHLSIRLKEHIHPCIDLAPPSRTISESMSKQSSHCSREAGVCVAGLTSPGLRHDTSIPTAEILGLSVPHPYCGYSSGAKNCAAVIRWARCYSIPVSGQCSRRLVIGAATRPQAVTLNYTKQAPTSSGITDPTSAGW